MEPRGGAAEEGGGGGGGGTAPDTAARVPQLFPPAQITLPPMIQVKHLVPRHILLELLACQKQWELFKENPTKTVSSLITSTLHSTMTDTTLPDSVRMERYQRLIQLQKDWNDSFSLSTLSSTAHQSDALPEPPKVQDGWDNVLSSLPQPLRDKSANLVDGLKRFPNIISCNSRGNLSVRSVLISSSHIGDIIFAVNRPNSAPPGVKDLRRYWRVKNISGLEPFLRAFASTSLPASLLRNSYFVQVIRQLRDNPQSSSKSTLHSWRYKMK